MTILSCQQEVSADVAPLESPSVDSTMNRYDFFNSSKSAGVVIFFNFDISRDS